MSQLSGSDFERFFEELHCRSPYSWQTRLAARAIDGRWPGAIDLPTGSGKTACIDIAVFALACQAGRSVADRSAPRRIFFCVNRRVIVDEAHQRALRIARRLWEVERGEGPASPILRTVAAALRSLAGTTESDDAPPLDVLELRGGIYRDNRWARTATQPTIVCTTIDQLGSRLLFRGYGVSPSAAPIQAALIAYDSLVLLDEAHISEPFRQSLAQVREYLNPVAWAEEPSGARPMVVVPMTATPPIGVSPDDVIRLDDEDRKNPALDRRLGAPKRASLRSVADVAKAIVAEAEALADAGPAAIGIIVNRVATARDIDRLLRDKQPGAVVELVIGSMRPIDRDAQSKRLAPRVGPDRPQASATTSFVIATQCLEVGADYDFDVIITECASMDALRQRFGRLNRGGRPIESRAVIVVRQKDVRPEDALDDENPLDPIYGNALARTWNWLWDHADEPAAPEAVETTGKRPKGKAKPATETRTVDFGIDAFNALLGEHSGGRIPKLLLAPSASLNAPVMLPAYVDFWCQTAPSPVPDPDIGLFLHGPERGEPDVQVCWRADMLDDEHSHDQWCDVVALVPPTAAECMSVPISRVRCWLVDEEDRAADQGDLLAGAATAGDDEDRDRNQKQRAPRTRGVLWRGTEKTKLLESADELRPGDTLVLPAMVGGWNELGHIPPRTAQAEEPERVVSPGDEWRTFDVAESAFEAARSKCVLRLHPWRFNLLPAIDGTAIKDLRDRLADGDDPPNVDELRHLMREAANAFPENDEFRKRLGWFAIEKNKFISEPYPDGRGLVLTARDRLKNGLLRDVPALDDGDDDASRMGREAPVSLRDHTQDVRDALTHTLNLIASSVHHDVYDLAAERHDWGKADERFQALLRNTDRTDAWLSTGAAPLLLAKSGMPRTPHERRAARRRAGLPEGFRHEMLSVQLAERVPVPDNLAAERDLVLHLIAAHHGYARPFAPVVLDDDPPEVEHEGVALGSADRKQHPAHRLDSGIADRFWSLTRRFGWWGLAYLEALLRLADQQASAAEDARKPDTSDVTSCAGSHP